MKRLIVVFCTSFFVLMIIWLFVGYAEYGDEVLNKHLDFQTMIYRLDDVHIDVFDFVDDLKKFRDTLLTFNSDGGNVFNNILHWLIRPITFTIDMFYVILNFVVSVVQFVFQPVFY